MGRTFENRKQKILKRGARDNKAFTRCARQIVMAVRAGGADPHSNPALRRAMQNARAANMSKDKVQTSIDKALGAGAGEDYREVIYEGYGPHGVPMLVVTTTDNPTRTVANVRAAFKKGGGNLGNEGSVAFMFEQFGYFRISPEGIAREELELELIDHGLEGMDDDEDDKGEAELVLRCARDEFGTLQAALEDRKLEIKSSGFEWIPQNTQSLGEAETEEIGKLIDRLEDDDDVQHVFHNLA